MVRRKKTSSSIHKKSGHSPSNSNNVLRVTSACCRCRHRKVGCDEKFPRCSKCEEAGIECFDLEPLTGRKVPRSYVFYLENRIAALENILKKHGLTKDAQTEAASISEKREGSSKSALNITSNELSVFEKSDFQLYSLIDDYFLLHGNANDNAVMKLERRPFKFLLFSGNMPYMSLLAGLKYFKSMNWNRVYFENTQFKKVKLILQAYYGRDHIDIQSSMTRPQDFFLMRETLSRNGLKLGVTLSSFWKEELVDEIKKNLPDRYICDFLLALFFEKIYPFFPLIDETDFRADVNRILEYNSDGHVTSVRLKRHYDFAMLSLLLIILRLSYLSFFSNNVEENEKSLTSSLFTARRNVMTNPMPIDYYRLAERCLRQYNLLSNLDLEVFQAALFLKIYIVYAPEEGEVSTLNQNQIFNETLITMAESLGLRRDPEQYSPSSDEKTKNLRRRLWYHLVISDLEDSITYGTPIITAKSTYDVALPIVQNNSASDANIMENQISDHFRFVYPIIDNLHFILQEAFKLKSTMKVSDLSFRLSELEKAISRILGNYHEYISYEPLDPEFLKILRFKLHSYCLVFLAYMYHMISQYYGSKDCPKLHLFFLKKLLTIIYQELSLVNWDFFGKHESNFGSMFTLIFSPLAELINRLELTVSTSLDIRIKCTIHTLRSHPYKNDFRLKSSVEGTLDSLEKLERILQVHFDRNYTLAEMLGIRYLSSYKTKKNRKVFAEFRNNLDIINWDAKYVSKVVLKFFARDLEDLLQIVMVSSPQVVFDKTAECKQMCYGEEYLFQFNNSDDIVEIDNHAIQLLNSVHNDCFWIQLEKLKAELHGSAWTYELYDPVLTSKESENRNEKEVENHCLNSYIENNAFSLWGDLLHNE